MLCMTERQMKILETIIEQYAEIAVPVGSVTLAKLFASLQIPVDVDTATRGRLKVAR